ncbi:beta-lactamase family protein [Myxococcota bacterium]|nr:beta-lactamase family protein [Myxococcota bacterium]
MTALVLMTLLACTDKDADDTGGTTDGGAPDGGSGDGGTGGTVTQEGCEDRHAAFIAALEADLAGQDAPGVSAAIMEGGVVTCRVALGRKHAEGEEVPGVDTLFQLGSTTKMFTSLATLQRVEDGGLTLDTTLAQAYPDSEFAFDDTWNDLVTVEHMLTHQGGFYDYFDWAGSSDDADLAAFHEEVFFPYLWLMNEPGAFWNYSNPNFDVAGLIVEALDDRWFADLMVEDVFQPLGMTRTYMRKEQAVADGDYATGVGYFFGLNGATDYGPVGIDDVPDVASARPAGAGTWSTPTQVLQMARFLVEGDPAVLSDALRQEMTTLRVPLELTADDAGYGTGILVFPGLTIGDDYYPVPVWEHGGNTLSYSSAFYVLPEQGFAISILDSGYGSYWPAALTAAFEDLAGLPTPTTVPEYTFDPARLDLHTGTYEDTYGFGEMLVTRGGDTLFLELPLLTSLGYVVEPELEPISSDLWLVYLDGYPYDLTFLGAQDGGQSRWIRNRAFVGTRFEGKDLAAAPPDRAAVRQALLRARLPQGPRLGPGASLRLR